MLPYLIAVMAVGTDSLILSALLQPMAQQFGIDGATAAWAAAAHGIALAVAAPVVALAFGHVPRRSLMIAGLILLLSGAIAGTLATHFATLVASRFLAGSGAGIFLPACYAHAGDVASMGHRSRIMGRVMAGWSGALLAGLPVASLLSVGLDWRAGFLPAAALAGLAALMIGASRSIVPAATPLRLTVHDTRAFLRRMAVPLGVNFLNMLSFYGVYTFLGLALAEPHGANGALFGLLAQAYGFGLLASTLSAFLLDRFGLDRATATALLLLAGAIPFVAMARGETAVLVACMFFWGLFQGWCQTGIAALAAAEGGGQRGLATALLSTTTYLAVAAGAAGGSLIMTFAGFTALSLAAGVSAAAAALLLTLRRNYSPAALSSSTRNPPD